MYIFSGLVFGLGAAFFFWNTAEYALALIVGTFIFLLCLLTRNRKGVGRAFLIAGLTGVVFWFVTNPASAAIYMAVVYLMTVAFQNMNWEAVSDINPFDMY